VDFKQHCHFINSTNNKKINNDIEYDNDQNAKRTKPLLDVLIYQFQSGHIDLQNFDEYYLEQAILAANNIFQASTVIFIGCTNVCITSI